MTEYLISLMEQAEKWQCPFDEKLIQEIYPNYSHQQLAQYLGHPSINYALGCMFGSFIGDSLGSFLEFSTTLNQDLVEKAMQMSAGGPFNLREGQVTDDSEMSFHMLAALSRFDHNYSIADQKAALVTQIAIEYRKWSESRPFDMGITCRNGVKILRSQLQKRKYIDEDVFSKVKEINHKSESNGSLMRITPLVFLAVLISNGPHHNTGKYAFQQFQAIVYDEIRLIHPNQQVINSSLIWFRTLYMLCTRKSNKDTKKIWDYVRPLSQDNLSSWASQIDEEPMNATINQGWAKIAWTYGMKELRQIATEILAQNPSYKLDDFYFKRVISQIIARGGDTDTNAAIVGGMIGSLVGFKQLPTEYLRKMMELDFSNSKKAMKNDRPKFYEPRYAFALAYQNIERLFKTLKLQPKPKY